MELVLKPNQGEFQIPSIPSSNIETLPDSALIPIPSSNNQTLSASDVMMKLMSQFEHGLIDEKEFRRKQGLLMSRVNQVDTVKKEKNSVPKEKIEHQKGKPKILIIKGDMTVDELKSSFENSSGINIRIYNGKRFADGDSRLLSLGYRYPKPIKLKLNEMMMVGNLERAFKEKIGLSIQVENRKGKLADNSLSLFQI